MLRKFLKFKLLIGPKVWSYFLVSGFIGFLWFLSEISFVFILQGFLTTIGILQHDQSFLPSWYPVSLIHSVLILILFGLARSVIIMLKVYFANLTQLTFAYEQRMNILSLSFKHNNYISTKDSLATFTEVISTGASFTFNLSLLINSVTITFFLFLSGLKIAPIEMLSGVALLGICFIPIKLSSKKINVYGNETIVEWEKVSESLMRGLKNIFFLQIYNLIDKELEDNQKRLFNYKNSFLKYSMAQGFSSAFPLFLGIVILSIITYMSTKMSITQPVKLISFFYLFLRLSQSASESSSTFSSLKFAYPGITRLYDKKLMITDLNQRDKKPTQILTSKDICIEATNISFAYENSTAPLFENLSLKIQNGDTLVIKGESGVGKSTLLSIILGLNTPQSGNLSINKISTNEYFIDMHKILAYVGPEPYIINGSIKENLTYGLVSHQVSDKEIWDSLQAVELKEVVEALPNILDEVLTDIPQFSTGQKQRLSIARAILRSPSLLILDEATANLDIVTENKILKNLEPILKNSVKIIVTHKNTFDGLATKTLNLVKSEKID